jgi:hypothetical protein
MKKYIFLVAALLYFSISNAQHVGKVVNVNIPAPSLANNIIGEPTSQPIAVYLPPSYEKETEKRYPVIYFLLGYDEKVSDYLNGYAGYYLESTMNSNVTQGRIKEIILVIVNGNNLIDGCFFNNSPVTGNWEDFVVKDAVNYMDKNYRTIPKASSRAITGVSMGGYGSLHFSMKHPSLFSAGIGYCPGVANLSGVMKSDLFKDARVIKKVIALKKELSLLSHGAAHKKYLDTLKYFMNTKPSNGTSWEMLFSLAYGSAFAPDTSINAPYIKYPYTLNQENNLVLDTSIYKLYQTGFGDLKQKIAMYKDSLRKLKAYVIDYGLNDEYTWIREGSIYFDSLLTANQIPHRLITNKGGHGSLIKGQSESYHLPLFDSLLVFDTLHLSKEVGIDKFSCPGQIEAPVIDKENKKISIKIKSTVNMKNINPSIYVSPGAKISPFQNSLTPYLDFSSNELIYTITSENGKNTEVWKVSAKLEVVANIDKSKTNDIEIYPNPAYHSFSVKSANSAMKRIEVIDFSGRIIFAQNTNAYQLEVEKQQMCSGTYLLKTETDEGIFINKLIVR